jgi:hypothetical protein
MTCVMSWAELVMMIEGISITHIKRRKRYSKIDRFQQNRA